MRNAYQQMCDYGSRFRILKGGKISLVVSTLIASVTMLQASPSGGVVTAGSASIVQNGLTTNIIQTTNKAAINWNNFSIAKNETVNFNQPNVNAVTLNRVIGNEKSIIDGALNANGQVFILNSNGVLFSKNASINTAGLVATTMNLNDTDFINGNYNFKGDSSASVINQGTINISDKGYAALFGKEVINEGIIKATLGKVELVGAKEVTLNLNGNSLVNLHVNKGVLDALVENKGAIYADGGEVYLTTNAVNELLKGVVNNTGIVEANSIDDITGKIELFAHGGEAQVGGTIKAEGGFVETSGKEFTIKEGAIIKAKEWLIDPVNITIDSTLAGTISTALGTGDVTITTNGSNTPDTSGGESGTDGDIFVNSAITWASDNDLTLNAYRNIAINKNITATGTGGKLSLLYGQGSANGGANDDYTLASGVKIGLKDGQNFSTRKGTTVGNLKNYTVISTLGTATGLNNDVGLQGMRKANSTVLYAVGADIDASSTSTWNSGAGFTPIGLYTSSQEFTGSFDGLGHTIDSLYINNTTAFGVGLFGSIDKSTGTIRNINLTNVDITGTAGAVGALAGAIKNLGTIQNVFSSTKAGKYVSGGGHVGGLIGYMPATGAVIKNVSSSANVSVGNTGFGGGLIGVFQNGSLSNAYATGSVMGTGNDVGGLIGYASYTTFGYIDNVYATGNVSAAGKNDVGGLVGTSFAMPISNSYATGTVTGGGYVGGLVGKSTGVISSSYATGDVTGSSNYVGGFIGSAGNNVWLSYSLGNVNQTNGAAMDSTGGFIGAVDTAGDSAAITILKSYSSGTVTNGFGFIGKEVGDNYGNVHLDRNYWSSDVTDAYSIGMTFGYTPSAPEDAINISGQNLYSQGTYTNFDFGNEWYIIEGKMKPILRSEYSTTISNAHQLQLIGMDSTTLGASYTQARDIDFVSTAEMSKLWNPNNYFVSIGDGSFNFDYSVQYNFAGIYDGNSKTISNLNIKNGDGVNFNQGGADRINYLGLFGKTTSTSIIKNVGLESGSIMTSEGSYYVGGLVGLNQSLIENSYSKVNITGNGMQVGGLAGQSSGSNAIIRYSYSSGSIAGYSYIGGFLGTNDSGASIENSYSTGNVQSNWGNTGGFVSTNYGNITNSYSIGTLSSIGGASKNNTGIGAFIGAYYSGTLSNNFYDATLNAGQYAINKESGGGYMATAAPGQNVSPKTTEEMKTSSTFSNAGWNTSTVWGRKDTLNNGYMVLKGMYANDTSITFSTPITITLNGNVIKTYGDINPTLSYTSSNGSITLNWGSAMTQYTNAGTYAFSSTANIFAPTYGSGTADDYTITYNYGSYGITVNPYTLALSGFTAGNKVYNGNAAAVVSGTLGTALNGDIVTLLGTFADKNVGTGKTVTASLDNSNYTIAATTATANITAKLLSVITGITASTKTYDGTTTAILDHSGVGFTGMIGGDTLTIASDTGTFADKNVGTGKTVTISGITLGGADAGNYSIAGLTPTTTADITAKAVMLSAPDVTREYNGNATYTASVGDLATLSALLGVTGDSISAITLAFDNKNVGTNTKTLTPSVATINDGNSGNNYTITYAANTTSTISPKALSLSGAVANNKVYDGSSSATMTNYGTLAGIIGLEDVTIDTVSATSTFNDKNVGTGKTVTISGVTLGGADAANYTAGSSLTTTANITRLSSVTWIGGATGDWSNPANWAGGAIPDFSNVANVVIPVGKTVSFDAGLSAPVHVDNISSLGGLDVAVGTLNVTNLLSTATYNQTGGAVVGHDMTVTESYAQPAGTITMSGDVSINQAIGDVSVGELASNNLHVSTTNGAITQVAGSKINSTTSSTFVAGNDKDITLTNNDNEFGLLSMSGHDVSAKDKDALPLGNIIATGTVGITTTNGAISQSVGSKIEAGGDTTIVAGGDKDVTLTNDNNDFNHIAVTGKDINIKDKNDAITNNIIATGTVTITTTNGAISQSTGSKIEAGGDTTIVAGGDKDVTLGNDNNDFNKINVTGNDVSVKDKNGIEIGGLVATGTGQIETTTGNITQSSGSTVSVTGSTTLIAGNGGTVGLENLTNTFGGPINITASAATIGATTTPTFGTLTGLTSPTVQTPPQQAPSTNTQQVIDAIVQSVTPPANGGFNSFVNQPTFISRPSAQPLFVVTLESIPSGVNAGFTQGVRLSLVSQPAQGEATQRITLTELQISQEQGNGVPITQSDIRIALAQNSMIELVNGGVRLPTGLDQEFYVVEDRRIQR